MLFGGFENYSAANQGHSKSTNYTSLGNEIPSLFCWTKMGVEAGQELRSIIRRKELEREAGDGVFVWGIGNSLGPTIRGLGLKQGRLPVLFSPIQSKPRNVDIRPEALLIWLSYIDETGRVVALPQHSLVTSRAESGSVGLEKRHYALLCRSEKSLLEEEDGKIAFCELANATSNKSLGFSQVTALVKRFPVGPEQREKPGRTYHVPFRAEIFSPYCVRLTDGVVVPARFAQEITEAANTLDAGEWKTFVHSLKSLAIEVKVRQQEEGGPLFQIASAIHSESLMPSPSW